MRQVKILVLVAGAATMFLSLASCAAPVAVSEEQQGSSASAIGGRFDASYPAPVQQDDWSCSVHTTTWMLQSTANDATWSSVSQYMRGKGRVTPEQGLSEASGAGLAATLRELATGGPSVESQPYATFEEVAAKAGRMAVGIGGRAWNHWSAVRGYDAQAEELLLANSASGYRGVTQRMNKDQFARLGGMAMVSMDYNGSATNNAGPSSSSSSNNASAKPAAAEPFEQAARPASDPFPPLYVKGAFGAGFVTQCDYEGKSQWVWKTDGKGPDPTTRWGTPLYPELPLHGCGSRNAAGVHPLVLRNLRSGDQKGTWIVQCTGVGAHAQHVYRVDSEVDGHAAASFLYDEPNPDCD